MRTPPSPAEVGALLTPLLNMLRVSPFDAAEALQAVMRAMPARYTLALLSVLLHTAARTFADICRADTDEEAAMLQLCKAANVDPDKWADWEDDTASVPRVAAEWASALSFMFRRLASSGEESGDN